MCYETSLMVVISEGLRCQLKATSGLFVDRELEEKAG